MRATPTASLGPELDHASRWAVTAPELLGLDADLLGRAGGYVKSELLPITGLVVLVKGRPVLERYYYGTTAGERATRQSVTKSIISALAGIAVANGDVKSLDQRVTTYLGDKVTSQADRRIRDVRLRHLLTMSAGFEGDDAPGAFDYTYEQDWISETLNRKLVADPGQRWTYDGASSHLMSAVITKATGMPASEYAAKHLFTPIGIDEEIPWPADPAGNNTGGWGIELTPREMTRLGYLFLRSGRWNNRQVIPADYVKASTSTRIAVSEIGEDAWGYRWKDYGYSWWPFTSRDLGPGYTARGLGGQWIAVWPTHDAVVVIATDSSDNDWSAHRLLTDMVLPVVRRS